MKKYHKHLSAFLLIFFSFINCYSQNICPNPGFEQISACPAGSGELNLASPWNGAGVPADLFNFCHVNGAPPSCNDVNVPANFAGISSAHTGSSYAGFFTKRSTANQRTYLQAPVTPMVPNQVYRVSAFFKRSSASRFATNNIGISFSTSAISQIAGSFIAVTPQLKVNAVVADTSTWTSYSWFYNAAGGEAFISIGNFSNDAGTIAFNFSTPLAACTEMNSSAFYYIDDISIVPITEQLSITGDSTICVGESTTLTGVTNTQGWWSLSTAPADTIPAINNSITVAPVTNTTYIWNGIQSDVTVNVQVGLPPVVDLPDDSTVCEGISVMLDAGNPGDEFLWSNGANTQTILASDSGTYIVTVSNFYCAKKDTFELTVLVTPDVNLPETAVICPDNNEFILLDAGSGVSYIWSPGADTTKTKTAVAEGTYTVIVTHQNTCTKTGISVVKEVCSETLFFPGAFTPNSDGKNDLFYGDGTNLTEYNLKIFNRWGQLVHETDISGITGAWNGNFNDKPAPAGLYSYLADYASVQPNGKKKFFKKQGYFTLIR